MSTTPPFGFGSDDDPQRPEGTPNAGQFPGGFADLPLGPGGAPDLGALFTQLGQLFSWSGGPVNWDLSTSMARQTPEVAGDILSSSAAGQVREAMNVAQLWLDPVTTLPASSPQVQAWNRAEWVHHTVAQWKPYVEPVAARVNTALAQVLTEQMPGEHTPSSMASLPGPLEHMLGTMGAAMFGAQVGQALAALAQEVFATTDIGLPLGPAGVAALLPSNVAQFAEQAQRPEQEVLLYLALREAATLRLFGHAGWLAGRLRTDIIRYASDITIDTSRLEQAASQLDPALFSDPSMLDDPEAATVILDDLFSPTLTSDQQRVLDRLEGLLALIEGWVDTVVSAAAADHLPGAAALGESMRRRRATGGPAEQTFANLVGLQLRPRRLREAAALWQAVESARGQEGRDAVWDHPDYLPDPEDLDNPDAFAARRSASTDAALDLSELDADGPAKGEDGGEIKGKAEPGQEGNKGKEEPGTEVPGTEDD